MIEQIAKNMNMLEQLAVAIFRLVSAEVNGTAPDMKVNPYTINLGKKENAMVLDTESLNWPLHRMHPFQKMWM